MAGGAGGNERGALCLTADMHCAAGGRTRKQRWVGVGCDCCVQRWCPTERGVSAAPRPHHTHPCMRPSRAGAPMTTSAAVAQSACSPSASRAPMRVGTVRRTQTAAGMRLGPPTLWSALTTLARRECGRWWWVVCWGGVRPFASAVRLPNASLAPRILPPLLWSLQPAATTVAPCQPPASRAQAAQPQATQPRTAQPTASSQPPTAQP